MKDPRGFALKNSDGYSVFDKNKNKIAVNRINFPKCIDELGERGALLAIMYYISNGEFKSPINDTLQNEIILTIGDRG